MSGRAHHLLPAVFGILGIATVWANAGYLPQVGPVPLRFRIPPPLPVNQAAAPLPTPITLPTPPISSSTPETPQAGPEKEIVVPKPGPAVEIEAGAPAFIRPPVVAPDAVISPQMLIKYFMNSTNAPTNNAPGVGVPFGFTPPAAGTPVSTSPPRSKATYSISP